MIMNKLSKIILAIVLVLTAYTAQAQDLIQNNGFKNIPVSQGKAILMKEILLNSPNETNGNYDKLKNWIKQNYTTDLINSSIKYNASEYSVYVKSKVELLLPLLNVNQESAKATMNYYMSVFIEKGKCVVIFSDITYKLHNTYPSLTKKLRAEEFVTDEVLRYNDEYKQQRTEVQRGTLYYFNNLVQGLGKTLNGAANN